MSQQLKISSNIYIDIYIDWTIAAFRVLSLFFIYFRLSLLKTYASSIRTIITSLFYHFLLASYSAVTKNARKFA